MKITHALARATLAASLVATAFAPLPSLAAAMTYAADTTVVIKGINVVIKAGSEADSFTQNAGGFTVTVAANEAFIVRTPIENPMALENDAGRPTCNVLPTQENQLVINGPRTANVTVSSTPCPKDNYATNGTTLLKITQPNGGETVTTGAQALVLWQVTNGNPAAVRMRLSMDGGLTYPTSVFADQVSNGYYQWNVPSDMATTSHARLKIEAVDQSFITATDVSDADFTISTSPPPASSPDPGLPKDSAPPASSPDPGQPTTSGPGGGTTSQPTGTSSTSAYDPAAVTAAATSIDADRGFAAATGVAPCVTGTRIKGETSAAVYYCGADHKRHAFPNEHIYFSWFTDFDGVITVSDAELASASLGANVTYRPGVRMVKITTDPKVYAVDKGGSLRWVPDEATAKKLYGDAWNKKIDDVPDAFFFDYKIGEQIPAQ
jgi:hypothetical protein